MVKQIASSQSQVSVQPVKDMRLERDRMTDVMLLLETLFTREESTVKQVLDCLYDVGSVNLIDQRVQIHCLNRLAKWIARFSKPVFRVIALRWFKQNCPQLITEWLYTQVKFEPKQIAHVVAAVETAKAATETALQPVPTPDLDLYRQKVRLLRGRVRLLTTLLIGVTLTLGSGLVWSLGRSQTQAEGGLLPALGWIDQTESCDGPLQPCQ